MRILLFLFLILSLRSPSFADQVLSCHDGDTCKVRKDSGQIVSVRIKGIDAPEISQPFGRQARDFMSHQAVGKTVNLACKGKAQTREACWIFANGNDLGRAIVQAGLAWDYPQFSGGYYQFDQAGAMAKKKGLWAGNGQSPYCWRHPSKDPCHKNLLFVP